MEIPMPPDWFNPHGLRMVRVSGPTLLTVSQEMMISVCNNAAMLKIIKSLDQATYKVSWQTNHGPGEFVQGQVQLSKHELEEAFELCLNPPRSVFAEFLNVDVGIQGHYVRKNRWLNIPAPGNSFDGDPNISVFVTDDIQDVIRKLISS